MALRRMLGFSDGELMRSDSKPCTRLMRHTAGIFLWEETWAFGFSAACITVRESQFLELVDGLFVELPQ